MNRFVFLFLFIISSFSICATQYKNCVDEASFLKEFEHILRTPGQLSNDLNDVKAKKVIEGQNLEYYFNKGVYVSKGSFGRVNRVNIYHKNLKLYYSTPKDISISTQTDIDNFNNMKKLAGDMANEVAFKQIPKPDPNSTHKTIFEREIGIQMKLNPSNATAKLYWCVETPTYLYLIMESMKVDLIAATSLATFQFLDLQTRLQKFTYIARLYEKMHKFGYSHEDLKPDNIMATNSDLKDFRIIDFGLSGKICDRPIGGTPIYNRPNKFSILEGSKITHLNDIYGLALTFMVMESNEAKIFAGISNSCLTARFDSNCKKNLFNNINSVISSRDLLCIKDIIYRATEFTLPLFGSMKEFADALEGEYIKLKNQKADPIKSVANYDIIRQSLMVHEYIDRNEIEKAIEANHNYEGKIKGELATPMYYEVDKDAGAKEQQPDQNMTEPQLNHQQKVEQIKKQQQQDGKDNVYYSNHQQQPKVQQAQAQQPQAKGMMYYSNHKQQVLQPQVLQPKVILQKVILQKVIQPQVIQQVHKIGYYGNPQDAYYQVAGNNQPVTKKIIQIPISNIPQNNMQIVNHNQNYNLQNNTHKKAGSLSPHNFNNPQNVVANPKQDTIVKFLDFEGILCPVANNPPPVKFGHLCDTKNTPDSVLTLYSRYTQDPSYNQVTNGEVVYFYMPSKPGVYVKMPITKVII